MMSVYEIYGNSFILNVFFNFLLEILVILGFVGYNIFFLICLINIKREIKVF